MEESLIMAKQDKKGLVTIILNGLIVVLVILFFILALNNVGSSSLTSPGWGLLKYYTVLSNLLSGIAAAILLPYQIISFKRKDGIVPLWAILIKFAAAVALMITFLVTACYLGPTSVINGGTYWSMFEGTNMIVHFFVPMLAFISFCFLETSKRISFRFSFLGLSTVVAYGIFYVINHYAELIPGDGVEGQSQYDWYGFFQNESIPVVILIMVFMLGFAYLLSFMLWLLNRKMGERESKKSE